MSQSIAEPFFLPTGIAHKATEDNVYNDYFIPKGSIVHPNLWLVHTPNTNLLFVLISPSRAIHYDPELYPEPETFNPNRWLLPEYPTYREPLTQYPNMNNYSVFGFGRRLCPGAHIAERSINMIAARVSWACNIQKSIDPATGEKITPPEYDCEHFPSPIDCWLSATFFPNLLGWEATLINVRDNRREGSKYGTAHFPVRSYLPFSRALESSQESSSRSDRRVEKDSGLKNGGSAQVGYPRKHRRNTVAFFNSIGIYCPWT